jgi:hypothetical protein
MTSEMTDAPPLWGIEADDVSGATLPFALSPNNTSAPSWAAFPMVAKYSIASRRSAG